MHHHEFKPAWWLRNPHLQTIWPALIRRRHKIKNLALVRERLELPDGDFIDLDWAHHQDTSKPIVLLLHGFEGSIDSHYARGMVHAITQQGWRAVFMHFRGCSGEPNRLPRLYHSGETQDVAYVTRLLREREPEATIAAIGVSLGGNVLLKWLGETRETNVLKAAIAISVPFELHKAVAHIQKGLPRFYQEHFLKCLRKRLQHKFTVVPSPIHPSILDELETLRDFDEKITAPLHGFSDADDYYFTASSRQYVGAIQVPTLILHASDDPLMTSDVVPTKNELSPYVKLEITQGGGHVGFVSGKYPWRPEYWLEKRIPEFLCNHLSI